MKLHESTFEYLAPTEAQKSTMDTARELSKNYCLDIAQMLPDGPDKTYIIRRIRETAMWINVTITRDADGAPRP